MAEPIRIQVVLAPTDIAAAGQQIARQLQSALDSSIGSATATGKKIGSALSSGLDDTIKKATQLRDAVASIGSSRVTISGSNTQAIDSETAALKRQESQINSVTQAAARAQSVTEKPIIVFNRQESDAAAISAFNSRVTQVRASSLMPQDVLAGNNATQQASATASSAAATAAALKKQEAATLSLAQANARLLVSVGNSADASKTLRTAIDSVTTVTAGVIRAETQFVGVEANRATAASKAETAMIREAQAIARLKQTSGDSAGAIKTLDDALKKASNPGSLAAIRAELQKTYLTTNYANSPLISAIRSTNQGIVDFLPLLGSTGTGLQRVINTGSSAAEKLGLVGKGAATAGAGIDEAGSAANGLSLSLGTVALGLGVVAALGVALGVSITKSFIDASIEGGKLASKMVELSRNTGLSVQSLAFYKIAAEQSGSSVDALAHGIELLDKKLENARDGEKKSADLFRALGVDIKSAGEDPQKAFEDLAVKIASIQDPVLRVKVATELLGRSGANLIATFIQIKEQGAAIRARMEELGLVMGVTTLKGAKALNDELVILGAETDALKIKIANDLAPELVAAIQSVENSLAKLTPVIEGIGSQFIISLGPAVALLSLLANKIDDLFGGAAKRAADAARLALGKLDPNTSQGKQAVASSNAAQLLGKQTGLGVDENSGLARLGPRLQTQAEIEADKLRAALSERFNKSASGAESKARALREAELKSQLDFLKEAERLQKDSNDRELKLLQQQFDDSQILTAAGFSAAEFQLSDFYAEKLRLTKANIEGQIKLIDLEIAADQKTLLAAKANTPERVRLLQDINKLTTDRIILIRSLTDAEQENFRKFDESLKTQRENLLKETQQLALPARPDELPSALIKPNAPSPIIQQADARIQAARDASIQFRTQDIQLQQQHLQIQNAVNAGQITEAQGKEATLAIQRQYRDVLIEQLEIQKAALGVDDQSIEKAAQLNVEIEKLRGLGGELTPAQAFFKGLRSQAETTAEAFEKIGQKFKDSILAPIDAGIDKLTAKFGIFKDVLGDILKLLARQIVSKLFGGGGQLGGAGGASGGGGFNLGGLINSAIGGGGGQGGGSFLTGGFAGGNPAQQILGGGQQQGGGGILGSILGGGGQSSGGGGGISGILGKILGGGSSSGGGGINNLPVFTQGEGGGALSQSGGLLGGLGGSGGGLGASLGGLAAGGAVVGGGLLGSLAGGKSQVGQLLGGVGGSLLGGFAAATFLNPALLPVLFSNPITAVIGAALIGGALLFNFFAGREQRKFRKEVENEYQLKVDGKEPGTALYQSIKALGEQTFGKGKFGKKIVDTIRLDKAQEQLAAYGEATGQENNPLVVKFRDQKNLTDVNDPRNQFVKRAFGGFVPFPDMGTDSVLTALRGREYVNTPEVVARHGVGAFDALQAGNATIAPVQSKADGGFVAPSRVRIYPASSGGSGQYPGGDAGGWLAGLMQMIQASIGASARMTLAAEGLDAVPYDHVVSKALQSNPHIAAEAVDESIRSTSPAGMRIKGRIYGGK